MKLALSILFKEYFSNFLFILKSSYYFFLNLQIEFMKHLYYLIIHTIIRLILILFTYYLLSLFLSFLDFHLVFFCFFSSLFSYIQMNMKICFANFIFSQINLMNFFYVQSLSLILINLPVPLDDHMNYFFSFFYLFYFSSSCKCIRLLLLSK